MRVVAGAVVVVHHPELFSEVGGEEEGVQLQCAMCNVQLQCATAMCNVQCTRCNVQEKQNWKLLPSSNRKWNSEEFIIPGCGSCASAQGQEQLLSEVGRRTGRVATETKIGKHSPFRLSPEVASSNQRLFLALEISTGYITYKHCNSAKLPWQCNFWVLGLVLGRVVFCNYLGVS